MKRLIAQRQIQYMGRTYERGAVIPAQDTRMVEAWLKAGSAAWAGDTKTAEEVTREVREAARRSRVNNMAAEAIRAMGVIVEDDAGEFVGAVNIEDQIRAMFGPGSLQNNVGNEKGQEPTGGDNHGQNGQEMPEETETSEGDGTPAMLTGHLDAADLEKWKKGDLEKLAAEMGVDISKARNNTERAAILAAVEVQAPANDTENSEGGL